MLDWYLVGASTGFISDSLGARAVTSVVFLFFFHFSQSQHSFVSNKRKYFDVSKHRLDVLVWLFCKELIFADYCGSCG